MIEKENIFSTVVAKFSFAFVNLLALNSELKLNFDNLIETFRVELKTDKSFYYVVGSWDEIQNIRDNIYKHVTTLAASSNNHEITRPNGICKNDVKDIIDGSFDFFEQSDISLRENIEGVNCKLVSHDANDILNKNIPRISSQNTLNEETAVTMKDFFVDNFRDNNVDYNNNKIINNDIDDIINIFEIDNANNQYTNNNLNDNLLENKEKKISQNEANIQQDIIDLDKKQKEHTFVQNLNNDSEESMKTLELIMNIKKSEEENLVEYLLSKNFEDTSNNHQTENKYQENNYDTKSFNNGQQLSEENNFLNFNSTQFEKKNETLNYVNDPSSNNADNTNILNNNDSIFETGSKGKGQLVNLSSAILDLCIQEQAFSKTTGTNQRSIINQISHSNHPPILTNSFLPITTPYTTQDQMTNTQMIANTSQSSALQSDINVSNTFINSISSVVTEDNAKNSNFCQLCNKTFLNKSNLMRHQKSIHRKSGSGLSNVAVDRNGSKLIKNLTSERNFENEDYNQDEKGFQFDVSNGEIVDRTLNISRSKRSRKTSGRTCRFCLKAFSSSSFLVEHLKVCENVFKCSRCNEAFETHNLLSQHLYNQHELFSCWMCDKVADSMESYADHVNFCHPSYQLDKTDSSVAFNQAPPSINQQPQQMTISTQQVTPVLPSIQPPPTSTQQSTLDVTKAMRCHGPNPCIKCGKVFSTFSNLLKHVRVIHENSRFPCNLCKRVFACKEGLKSHLNKIHEKISHKCTICSMEFENQLRLAKHLSLIHNNQSSIHSFQCDQCSKSFLYKTNLKRHKKLDHEGLRYVCDRCFQPFRSKSQLLEHTRISHLGQPLQCSLCPSQFHSWGVLRDHERAVHNKHSPIICAICGAKFNRYPSLSYHLKKNHKRRFNVAGEIIYDPKKPPKTQQDDKSQNVVLPSVNTTQHQTIMDNLKEYGNTFSANLFSADNNINSPNVHTNFVTSDNSNDKTTFEMRNETYNSNANILSTDLFKNYASFPYNNELMPNTNKQNFEQNMTQFQNGSSDELTQLFAHPSFFQSEQSSSFLKTLEHPSGHDLVPKTESSGAYSKNVQNNGNNFPNELKFYENFF